MTAPTPPPKKKEEEVNNADFQLSLFGWGKQKHLKIQVHMLHYKENYKPANQVEVKVDQHPICSSVSSSSLQFLQRLAETSEREREREMQGNSRINSTIFSRLQTSPRKFAECVSNLQKKNVRMLMFLHLHSKRKIFRGKLKEWKCVYSQSVFG